jgi:hypothetical protein
LHDAFAPAVKLDPGRLAFHISVTRETPHMLHPSTQQLICKLHELTQAGSLAWTIGDCDALRLWTEGYVVEIEAAPTTFRLLRDDGRVLETATSDILASTNLPDGSGSYAERVQDLAAHAHRIATGRESATSAVMSALSAPVMRAAGSARLRPTASFGATETFVRTYRPDRPSSPASSLAEARNIYSPWT